MVIGTPESWAQTIAISGKEEFDGTPIWSPCGRFVAARTRSAVEIRNQLTLELITILQPTEMILNLRGPLAYSPDGRSIACASDTAVMIWDIQTGGVAKEIKRRANTTSLVWSPDGQTICTVDLEDRRTFAMHTYDVSSGTISSLGTVRSEHDPHLWMVDKSFRVMTTARNGWNIDIFIFEVGSTLTRIRSFSWYSLNAMVISFCPTTHHVSILDGDILYIFDIRSLRRYLHEFGRFLSCCFSSDGSLFAASREDMVRVWKYDSGSYTLCGELCCRGPYNPLRFSQTSSSILGHSKDFLRVWHLHGLPTSLKTRLHQYAGLSRSGTRVVTAHKMGRTVTITDLLTQVPLQIIDTGMAIEGLVLTGNVLLVAGSGQVIAWLLTGEGLVDGIGNGRVGRGDSIWIIWGSPTELLVHDLWMFLVEGQVGVIGISVHYLRVYHTETGKILHLARAPQNFGDRWRALGEVFCSWGYPPHTLSQDNAPPEGMWQTSQATLRNGWVKDPEGKHRLWVPVEWRTDWDPADWRHDVTIQLGTLGGRIVLIKF